MRGRPLPGALAATLAVLACAGLLGCVGPARTPATVYYTLAIPGSPPAALPGPVQVRTFGAETPYAGARLAYRTSPYRMEYYSFHRWAAGSAQAAVTAAVRDYLDRARAPADGPVVRIDGRVRRIEELDEAGGRSGVVAIDFSVQRGGRPWLERSYEDSEPARAGTPEAVVAAMSRALGRILDRLLEDLADTPVGEPRARSGPFPARGRESARPAHLAAEVADDG
jgi:ABC-type uncharacterized transport system auxiliary subunit